MYLVEVWCWFSLTDSVEILHVDQLIVIAKPRVSNNVLWPACDVGKVPQSEVAPAIEGAEGRAGPSLCVQLDGRHSQTNKPCEHRLLHV